MKINKQRYQYSHPELDSGSSTFPLQFINNLRRRCQSKFGMTPLCNNGGFTLIELLVVVLIIGILAAVALPQYQKVIFDIQMSEVITNARQLAKQIELYYIEHGTYPQYWKELDLTWSNCTEGNTGLAYLICPHFYADLNEANFIIYKTPNGVYSFSPLFIRYNFIHTEATTAGRLLCNSSGQGNDFGTYYCKKLCAQKDCYFR